MAGIGAIKGGLRAASELPQVKATYDWLLDFLGRAPRDDFGRVPLSSVNRKDFDAMLTLPPEAPGGLVFRGEPEVPVDNVGTFVAKWPRHAMAYAADDYGTVQKPYGFLSVYDVPWSKLPEYDYNTTGDLIFDLVGTALNERNMPELPKSVVKAGGAKILNLMDNALGPAGKWDESFQHAHPQGIIFDKRMLQRKKHGGLVQMKAKGGLV